MNQIAFHVVLHVRRTVTVTVSGLVFSVSILNDVIRVVKTVCTHIMFKPLAAEFLTAYTCYIH